MSDAPIHAPEPLLVTLAETLRLLSLGKTKVNELCHAGALERRKAGRRTLITMASIRRFAGLENN